MESRIAKLAKEVPSIATILVDVNSVPGTLMKTVGVTQVGGKGLGRRGVRAGGPVTPLKTVVTQVGLGALGI